jgi:hypothetical protein
MAIESERTDQLASRAFRTVRNEWFANWWRRSRPIADAGTSTTDAGSVVVPVPSPAPTTTDAGTAPVADAAVPGAAGTSSSAGAGSSAAAGSGASVTPEGPFGGGFLEPSSSTALRRRLSAAELAELLPSAGGKFTFPSPYGTEAVRLTDASTCGGSGDCVRYLGYSYWRNMNNHVGQSTMLIVLGLDSSRGGAGFSLFRYHKDSDDVESLGPVFAGTSIPVDVTGEDIYFSGTQPTIVYVAQGSRLMRFDVMTKQTEVVFDAASQYGSNTYLWQHHTSDDDVVHSATLRVTSTGAVLGCLVYREDTSAYRLFEPQGDFDECQVDRSGRWLVIKDNVDGRNGEDNRIVNLDTFAESLLLDEQGAGGHSDFGHGVMVAEDNWNNLAGAVRAWRLGQSALAGPVVYHEPRWRSDGSSHISHTNARPGLAAEDEIVCQSTSARGEYTRGSEIFCYRLDGSLEVMVVAPVMTDLDASGGGDDYAKSPKGNLDVTGRYFIWTSNTGGARLDAFIVKVPSLLD